MLLDLFSQELPKNILPFDGETLYCGIVLSVKEQKFYYNAFLKNIDWKNDIGKANETSERTRILVFQPSFELGYWASIPNTPWCFSVSGGAGIEVNVVTEGKPVGEGGMWLATLSILRKI